MYQCVEYRTPLRIYDFLKVPWGLGRLPWVPGVPPGGSLEGGPDPNSESQNMPGPLGFGIVFYVDFGSFWARSSDPLGGHFRSFWRLVRPKSAPEPSSSRLIFENVIFNETLRFP